MANNIPNYLPLYTAALRHSDQLAQNDTGLPRGIYRVIEPDLPLKEGLVQSRTPNSIYILREGLPFQEILTSADYFDLDGSGNRIRKVGILKVDLTVN